MYVCVQYGIELKTQINIDYLKAQTQRLSFSNTVVVKIKVINALVKIG